MKQEEQHRSDYCENLHSLQKSSKIIKKPQPLPASRGPQPKVYNVKPIHFRELVQKLTGATQPQQPPPPQARSRRRNLQIVAPPAPPLLSPQTNGSSNSEKQVQVQCKVEENHQDQTEQPQKPPLLSDKLQNDGVGTTELILSPNFQAWFSFAMMSPGSAHLDHSSLL